MVFQMSCKHHPRCRRSSCVLQQHRSPPRTGTFNRRRIVGSAYSQILFLMAYPDFGGGSAYGDAYEQGAGFYAANAENESPNKGGKSSKSGQPVIPVTICQINVLMRETGGEGSFTLDVRC
jgi:hypothetical protein